MAGEPKIFTKNYVNDDDVFTVTHAEDIFDLAYDRDTNSQYASVEANNDTITVTATIEFYEGADPVDREFNRLMVFNHNLKDWKLQYWDDSAWQDIAETVFTTDSENNRIITFDAITSAKVMLTMNKTKVADEEKKIGEILICKELHQFELGFSSYRESFEEMVRKYKLADGSYERAYIKWAGDRLSKYGCHWGVEAVSVSERNKLFAIKEIGDFFLWQPESVTRPYRVFLVYWDSPWQEQYFGNRKCGDYNIEAKFKEI